MLSTPFHNTSTETSKETVEEDGYNSLSRMLLQSFQKGWSVRSWWNRKGTDACFRGEFISLKTQRAALTG